MREQEIIAAAKCLMRTALSSACRMDMEQLLRRTAEILTGAKQLLCIARVMLTLPPMRILGTRDLLIDTAREMQSSGRLKK